MACLQRSLLGGGEPALADDGRGERLVLDDDSWVDVARGWLAGADTLFDHLAATVPWRHGRRWMYDRIVDEPRLTRAYARGEPLPHPALSEILAALDRAHDTRFGGVFLNYYRDGRDSVAFHRDRELRESATGVIAIVTLGATRPFLLRPRGGGRSLDVRPGSGDLLVMRGRCHRDWEHSVPKVAAAGPRISVSTRALSACRAAPASASPRRTRSRR
jgi:alkylated DNA repair dioxygenase AlkB